MGLGTKIYRRFLSTVKRGWRMRNSVLFSIKRHSRFMSACHYTATLLLLSSFCFLQIGYDIPFFFFNPFFFVVLLFFLSLSTFFSCLFLIFYILHLFFSFFFLLYCNVLFISFTFQILFFSMYVSGFFPTFIPSWSFSLLFLFFISYRYVLFHWLLFIGIAG